MNDTQKTLSTKNLALNLYNLRKESRITVEQFAEDLDVSTRIVYDWESGKKCPTIERLIKIAYYFGVKIDSILQEM